MIVVAKVQFKVRGVERARVCEDFDEMVEVLEELVGDFEEVSGSLGPEIVVQMVKMSEKDHRALLQDEAYG